MRNLILFIILRITLVTMLLVAAGWFLKTVATGAEGYDSILAFLGAVYPILEIFRNRDYFRTDPSLKSEPRSTNATVEDYLEGRLRAYAEEERLFVKLAGSAIDIALSADTHEFTDMDEALAKYPSGFVLIGDPGAGKSTVLRHLEKTLIERYRRGDTKPKPRWPLAVNLGLTSNPVEANDLLEHWWQRHYLPGTKKQAVSRHAFYLLLDGLNEMPLDTREKRAESLQNFLKQQEVPIPAIVTCRIDDYRQDEQLHFDLPVIHIHELDDGRIKEFLQKRGVTGLWETLEKPEHEALLRMARNPYKLAMLVSVYNPQEKKLPANLNELYRRYLEKAYADYRPERQARALTILIGLPWKKLEAKLKTLAFRMLTDGNGLSLPVDKARRHVGNAALIDGINMGVLKRVGDEIQFYHQSLHGYFAIEPLSRALTINNRFDRITKNPAALIQQIGDLGENGAPAIDPLMRVLGDQDTDIRNSAVDALGKIGDPAVSSLLHALADPDGNAHNGVTDALGKIGKSVVDPLIHVLADSEPFVRSRAADALGRIGTSKAVDPLIHVLADSEPFVRSRAADALGRVGASKAVDPLIRALGDQDESVRSRAADALGQIGASKAVDPLIRALSDQDESVRDRAVDALRKIGEPAISSLIRVLDDQDESVRSLAVDALGKIGASKAVNPLIRALGDQDESVRDRAVDTLRKIGEPVVPFLIRALANQDRSIRRKAADALGKIGDPRAVAPLIETLVDQEQWVRSRAAEALGLIGDPRAIVPLTHVLADRDPFVKIMAQQAIDKIRAKNNL